MHIYFFFFFQKSKKNIKQEKSLQLSHILTSVSLFRIIFPIIHQCLSSKLDYLRKVLHILFTFVSHYRALCLKPLLSANKNTDSPPSCCCELDRANLDLQFLHVLLKRNNKVDLSPCKSVTVDLIQNVLLFLINKKQSAVEYHLNVKFQWQLASNENPASMSNMGHPIFCLVEMKNKILGRNHLIKPKI